MTHPHSPDLTLHVFEQDGGWHWALTIERQQGTGKKVVAYSETMFASQECAANNWPHDAGQRRSEFA
jgi:hypothetical protein